MMNTKEIIFAITIEDLQYKAKEKIGRKLSNEEIEVAKKGLDAGLLFDIDIVYDTIFSELIQ